MHRFEFAQSLETGNQDIDSQHQTMFAMVNEILFSSELERSPNQFRRAVTFLFSYLEYHFASEELAMLEQHYPSRRFHAAFHDHVRREASAIASEIARATAIEDARSRIFFLFEDWVVYHVHETDRQLAEFLSEHTPAGQTPRLPSLLTGNKASPGAHDFSNTDRVARNAAHA
jgi:hemerythrin-like metal-binding protein